MNELREKTVCFTGHREIREPLEEVVTLAAEYVSRIYYRRNRYLVDHSSLCIAYKLRENSGTGYTVHRAAEKGLRVVNLAAA